MCGQLIGVISINGKHVQYTEEYVNVLGLQQNYESQAAFPILISMDI